MTSIAVSLIFIGIIIFCFSFILKIGKKNFDKDFDEAIRNFEKQQEEQKLKENNNFEEYINNSQNDFDENTEELHKTEVSEEYESDDEDFIILIKQSKEFIRLIGITLIIIGIISCFL